jgi:hypothetical protein
MLQAFIGIVSQRGIELLCPEDAATERFLWRRAQRERGRAACFWSVIPSEVVELIKDALTCGLPGDALNLLQQQARDYGFLVPYRDESASPHVADYRG